MVEAIVDYRHVDACAVDAIGPGRFDVNVFILVFKVVKVPLARIQRVSGRPLASFYEGVVGGVMSGVKRVVRGGVCGHSYVIGASIKIVPDQEAV